MVKGRLTPNLQMWTVAAIAGLVWALIAVGFAALGPSKYVPHIFFSYHIEHFAAFYIVAILSAAGLPHTRLRRIGLGLAALAGVLAVIRMTIPTHQMSAAEDFAADVAGVMAALVPMMVGRFRALAAIEAVEEASQDP